MNELTKEKISIAVIKAIEEEKLMHKYVAYQFRISNSSMSCIKNSKYWSNISDQIWDDFRTWMYSGEKMKGYTPPRFKNEKEEIPVENPEPAKDIFKDLKKAKYLMVLLHMVGRDKKKTDPEKNNPENQEKTPDPPDEIPEIIDKEKFTIWLSKSHCFSGNESEEEPVTKDIILNIKVKLSIEQYHERNE